MCLLISGCHADYELNVSNDAIEDKVYFTLKSDDYEKAIENPIIVHFLGEERPWRVGNKNTYTPEYVRYWNKTPWKECGKEKGWENYFVVFNFFNIIMSKFPYCRYKIIDKLIPIFLKHRAKKK